MAHSGSDVEEALRLDREAIEAVDASDLLTDVLAIPEHMRDAQWKVESARLEEWDSPGGLVVAGMGGSAIGGALAKAALGDQASRPIFAARAYGLPAWTQPDTTVLCALVLGQHRGDARLLRGGGDARRAPHRRDERRRARRAWRARTTSP